MLAPRDTATRERESLDGLRRLSLDSAGVGRHEGWPQGLPAGAREIPVPASFNDVFAEAEVHDDVGDAWYETLVRAPAGWAGERIVLRFGSATHRAVVWVNGAQLAEHEGGYTPFEADDTEHVKPGAVNRITVLVNNALSWQPIPWPGYVEQTHLAGARGTVSYQVEAVGADGLEARDFADFASSSGVMRVDGNEEGVFTRNRRPKAAAEHLRRSWRGLR